MQFCDFLIQIQNDPGSTSIPIIGPASSSECTSNVIPDENNANTEQFWKSEVQRLEKELMHAKQKYNEAKVKDKKREFIMNRLEIIRSMKKRAIYKCRKCGLPKKGHVCVYTK